jgi:CheY-like chemotaxis protein
MSKKVILIEDNPDIIEVYKMAFKSSGIDVKSIIWGREAIKMIQDIQAGKVEKPGLFLIDLILPDISGMEILKEAKTTEATKDIPAFILSNYTSQDLKAADHIVPDKFILKTSITPTELAKLVKETLK